MTFARGRQSAAYHCRLSASYIKWNWNKSNEICAVQFFLPSTSRFIQVGHHLFIFCPPLFQNHTVWDLTFSQLWIIRYALGLCVACYQWVTTLRLRSIYIYLHYLATFSHRSPTQSSHADGKPYPGFHTTLGWHTSWHGQVTQSCPEDRSSHRRQYPLRSSRVWWKHGHVHAPACKFPASGNKLTYSI